MSLVYILNLYLFEKGQQRAFVTFVRWKCEKDFESCTRLATAQVRIQSRLATENVSNMQNNEI